jgi:(R,R)-butanediol dehydrogenase/meso-butanediol dehydrogenase/diacetyl reductase
MRAAVFHGAGDIRIEERDDPVPERGEVVVRVLACGICGTDVHEYKAGPVMFPISRRHHVTGHLGPLVPGHELAGEVVALGADVAGLAAGDLVACSAATWCGTCRWCQLGRTNLCERYAAVGLHRDGGLAEYCSVPVAACMRAGETGLGPDAIALAQPTAIAVHARSRSRLSKGESALVVGAGGVGAFLAYALLAAGVHVCVVDPEDARRQIAIDLGVHLAIAAPEPDELSGLLAEKRFDPDVVFEASGTPDGLASALGVARPGTRVVVVGLQGRPSPLDARSLALGEVEVIGTNALIRGVDLPEAVRLLSLAPSRLTSVAPEALPLSELVSEGLEPLAQGVTRRVKTLIDPWAAVRRQTQMTGALR